MTNTVEVLSKHDRLDIIPVHAIKRIISVGSDRSTLVVEGSQETLYMPGNSWSHTNQNPVFVTYAVALPSTVIATLLYGNAEESGASMVIDLKPFSGRNTETFDVEKIDQIVFPRQPLAKPII